jgi:glucan 1,4-alpha-glucosidase
MSRRPFAVVALLVAALAATAVPSQAAPPTGAAADGPGALSHFDLARKDCVGTARNRQSKVWYTVADGVLSDVYFPTNDNTNVETLQYVVTDGSTFTDLQTRDMTYTVTAPDDRSLSCRVTATAKSGRYKIVTDYVTDTEREAVVMRSRFTALKGKARDYRLYVRFDPTLNGNGGGGTGNGGADSGAIATAGGHTLLVGSDPVTATNAANRDYAVPVHSALDADSGFLDVSNGFAGQASDGLKQLDADHHLTNRYAEAATGNLVQTARVDLPRDGDFELALGLADTRAGAIGAARGSLKERFHDLTGAYDRGWHRYDGHLIAPRRPNGVAPGRWRALVDEYYLSANYVKAAEDKTFPGAVAASLTSPWGQAVSAGDPANTYFGSYREVFARDLYEAWTALFVAGDRATARSMTRFLFERQQLPDGSLPRNSLANGKPAPDSFNTQLDECAYPLVMALAVGLTGNQYYEDHIKPAANFVATRGPSFGPERWEEQSGFSPSTISAEIAGLLAAAKIAKLNGDRRSARVWRATADEFQRNLKRWTLTTNGPLSPDPYFIRLSKNGDPNEAVTYNLNNGGPTLDQREVIDAGFLEYARLGVLAEDDPDLVRSLAVVDATIRRSTDTGVGFYRYNGDGYGDRSSDGRPWAPTGQGNGHLWPVLAGERGQWELDRGNVGAAVTRLEAMQGTASGVGLIPEQAWEVPDIARSPFGTPPETASIGFENGKAAGSASALTWSAGQFVRLMRDVSARRILDRPRYTTRRYVRNTQGTTPLTVTAPADESEAGSSVVVAGTSAAGNTISIAATNIDPGPPATTVTETTAGAGGAFSVTVPLTPGTTVLNITATSPSGGTARAVRTVVQDVPPGTLLYETADPVGDDNGPGNYAYPTSSNFKPGAYDLEAFQVFDAGDRIVFRVRTRDLTPTFGSPLGAQLVDVYVHVPGASATSTAASFPGRNYAIAASGAWSRLIEVQGFGERYVDANGTALGDVIIGGNRVLRYITFSVTKASLGTPGPGWGFAVVLAGQDGFSPDQARGFAATPQEFAFGVCATASSDPHCTAAPGSVPKAMDVLVPAGTSQADELDYTLHNPVTIAPVVLP